MKKVTKTVTLTDVNAMVVSTTDRIVYDHMEQIVGSYENETEIIKALTLPENVVAVKVNSKEERNVLVGMDEETFMLWATKLEKRNAKYMCRTFTDTVGTVMIVDKPSATVMTMGYKLSGTYADEKAVLKAIEKKYANNDIAFVQVMTTRTEESLYGMPEETFVAFGEILPDRK